MLVRYINPRRTPYAVLSLLPVAFAKYDGIAVLAIANDMPARK